MDRKQIIRDLVEALIGVLAKDEHDRDCPKRRKSKEHRCSHRCSNARFALANARKLMAELEIKEKEDAARRASDTLGPLGVWESPTVEKKS